MNLDRIGATTVRMGAKAVARLFFNRSRLLQSIEMLPFVSPEY